MFTARRYTVLFFTTIGALALCAALLLSSSWVRLRERDDRVLYVYGWAEYIPAHVLREFTKRTGVRVVYDTFDTVESLEAKLFASRSGYDLILGAAPLKRQVDKNLFLPLNKKWLTNAHYIDERLWGYLSDADPLHQYAVPYLWGTTGIVYDALTLKALFPSAVIDSWRYVFDVGILKHLAAHKENIIWPDAQSDLMHAVAFSLHMPRTQHNINNQHEMQRIYQLLQEARPYVAYFESFNAIQRLLNKQACIAVVWSDYGNILVKQSKGRLRYVIPKEGACVWMDALYIPKDAVHVEYAHWFINFILQPEIIGRITNAQQTANAVPASKAFIEKSILNNPVIYPDEETMQRLFKECAMKEEGERKWMRYWTRLRYAAHRQTSPL